MKAVVQRVAEASVAVEGKTVGAIGRGLLVLVCAEKGDTDAEPAFLAGKIARMRIFPDDAGKMNLSLKDVGGAVLTVSQFTLAAQWRKGNRPGFSAAADPAEGERLTEAFSAAMEAEGVPVETGVFGADMKVSLINDGPVTLMLDHPGPGRSITTS